jgi:hypothetical protein
MAFHAYPRLPQKIPLRLYFFGQEPFMTEKSPLFFIYLLVQILFFIFFLVVTRIISSRKIAPWKAPIFKEYAYLTLVFFNLIFIHLQKSLILVSHQVAQGVDRYYFYLLFGIILVLIPYYRIRIKLFIKKPEETKYPPDLQPKSFHPLSQPSNNCKIVVFNTTIVVKYTTNEKF